MRNLKILTVSVLFSVNVSASQFICLDGNGREVPVFGLPAEALKRLPLKDCREIKRPEVVDKTRPMGQADRVTLRNLVSRFPQTLYSYQGFPFLQYPRRSTNLEFRHFSEETQIGHLTDNHGNLILFRDISQPYCPRYVEGTQYVVSEGNAYSYSLSPAIIRTWVNSEPNSYTLIAVQNIAQVFSPIWTAGSDGERLQWLPVGRETFVRDVGNFEEVKVPVASEQVLAVMKQSEIRRIVEEFGQRPFTLQQFFDRLLLSPSLGLPAEKCDEVPATRLK